MFTLRYTNILANGDRHFDTLDAAVAHGKGAGFEFTVWNGDRLLVSWSVFGGLRKIAA